MRVETTRLNTSARRNGAFLALALFAAVPTAAQAPPARGSVVDPLDTRILKPDTPVHGTIKRGDSAVFSFDVPPQMAARIKATQIGVDLALVLRREGAPMPREDRDLLPGLSGDEFAYAPIAAHHATWVVVVKPAGVRGEADGAYTVVLEVAPADETSRATADAHLAYSDALDALSRRDGDSLRLAGRAFESAVDKALAAGQTVLAAEAVNKCALVREQQGDQVGALVWLKRALTMFTELGRRDRQARILRRMSASARVTGDMAGAEEFLNQALLISREIGDQAANYELVAAAAAFKIATGRVEEAIQDMEAGLRVHTAFPGGILLRELGQAYYRLGRYDRAVELHERAVEAQRSALEQRNIGDTLVGLSLSYLASGEKIKARESIRTAITSLATAGQRTQRARAMRILAQIQFENGELDKAAETLGRALPVLRENRHGAGQADVLSLWARVDASRGDADAAIIKAEEATRLYEALGDAPGEAEARWVTATALRKKGLVKEARLASASAVASVEKTRAGLRAPDMRTSFFSTVKTYFDLHIELLQEAGATREAFETSERAHARALLDGLAESALKITARADPGLLTKDRAVRTALTLRAKDRLASALTRGDDGPQAKEASEAIKALEAEMRETEGLLKASSPEWAALQLPGPVSLDHVQKNLLDEGSALVEYHLGAQRSYAWVVDSKSITDHPLPPADQINEAARRYHTLLSRPVGPLSIAERRKHQREVEGLGRALAALVWTPVQARVAGKRVLLVADGALRYIPFAALPGPSGQALVAAHEIVSLPSASVLDTLRRGSRTVDARSIAVFADPVFSREDPRLLALAPAKPGGPQRLDEGQRSLLGVDLGSLSRLRFSRQEAEGISAASRKGAVTALDFGASKQALLSMDLSRQKVLHFATHGLLNTTNPEFSGLVLSLYDKQGRAVDGFLRLPDIYNLNLDADLVVLSACHTALGKEVLGEGLISLTRGFMYAGASRVISSVWKVDDRGSATLMSRLYAAMLSKGLTPAAALRQAQLSMIKDPRWSDPHYWAAFGLQGEWK